MTEIYFSLGLDTGLALSLGTWVQTARLSFYLFFPHFVFSQSISVILLFRPLTSIVDFPFLYCFHDS